MIVNALYRDAEKSGTWFDELGVDEFISTISIPDPFILSPVEGLRWVFRQPLVFFVESAP